MKRSKKIGVLPGGGLRGHLGRDADGGTQGKDQKQR